MDKKKLRMETLDQMKRISTDLHRLKSEQITKALLNDPVFQNAETIGITISNFPEVDTHQLIQLAWNYNKRVAVPKCKAKPRRMEFYAITSFDQLEVVYMNLQEPILNATEFIPSDSIDLMIVPGVVFSRDGFRIGFGGGFYDRYLKEFQGATRSLAFDIQIKDSIPIEPHDIPVDGIYTETAYIETGVDR